VETLLARSIQINHAELAEHVNPYSAALRALPADSLWSMHTAIGQAMLNDEINRQASMMAYIGDFKFMMVVTLSVVPLLFLLRNPHHRPSRAAQLEGAVEAALD
jgi:DHA2 family multidrug resistance protein